MIFVLLFFMFRGGVAINDTSSECISDYACISEGGNLLKSIDLSLVVRNARPSVRELAHSCRSACQDHDECEHFTYYDNNGAFPHTCFLFSTCHLNDQRCRHCHSGPRYCNPMHPPCTPIKEDFGGTWFCFPQLPSLDEPVPHGTRCIFQCPETMAFHTCEEGRWSVRPGETKCMCPPLDVVSDGEMVCWPPPELGQPVPAGTYCLHTCHGHPKHEMRCRHASWTMDPADLNCEAGARTRVLDAALGITSEAVQRNNKDLDLGIVLVNTLDSMIKESRKKEQTEMETNFGGEKLRMTKVQKSQNLELSVLDEEDMSVGVSTDGPNEQLRTEAATTAGFLNDKYEEDPYRYRLKDGPYAGSHHNVHDAHDVHDPHDAHDVHNAHDDIHNVHDAHGPGTPAETQPYVKSLPPASSYKKPGYHDPYDSSTPVVKDLSYGHEQHHGYSEHSYTKNPYSYTETPHSSYLPPAHSEKPSSSYLPPAPHTEKPHSSYLPPAPHTKHPHSSPETTEHPSPTPIVKDLGGAVRKLPDLPHRHTPHEYIPGTTPHIVATTYAPQIKHHPTTYEPYRAVVSSTYVPVHHPSSAGYHPSTPAGYHHPTTYRPKGYGDGHVMQVSGSSHVESSEVTPTSDPDPYKYKLKSNTLPTIFYDATGNVKNEKLKESHEKEDSHEDLSLEHEIEEQGQDGTSKIKKDIASKDISSDLQEPTINRLTNSALEQTSTRPSFVFPTSPTPFAPALSVRDSFRPLSRQEIIQQKLAMKDNKVTVQYSTGGQSVFIEQTIPKFTFWSNVAEKVGTNVASVAALAQSLDRTPKRLSESNRGDAVFNEADGRSREQTKRKINKSNDGINLQSLAAVSKFTCLHPAQPDNGSLRCTGPQTESGRLIVGSKCSLYCKPGFAPVGREWAECSKGGAWLSPAPLKCVPALAVLIGGWNPKEGLLNSVEVFDVRGECPIRRLPPLPEPRKGLLAGWVGGAIIACGGHNQTDASNKCWRFDPAIPAWEQIGSTATERHFASAVAVNSFLLALGGRDGGEEPMALGTSEVYDDANRQWNIEPDLKLPFERAYHCGALLDTDTLVLTGGYSWNTVLGTSETRNVTSSSTSEWTGLGGDLNTPRYLHACSPVALSSERNGVLVTGGYSDGYLDSTELFDPQVGEWREVGGMIVPRQGAQMAVLNGKPTVFGGFHALNKYPKIVEQFDLETGRWMTLGIKIKTPRRYFALAQVPETLFPSC